MRIALIDQTGTCRTIADKGYDCFLGSLEENADGYFCGQLTHTNGTGPVANSCTAMLRFSLEPEMLHEYLHALGCSGKDPVSYVYGLFNGKEFSDLIEVSFSGRFMNHEVGPHLGFTCGTAIKISEDFGAAIPQYTNVLESLSSMNYRGEVCFGIAKNFELVNLTFGHFYGHFALFAELALNKVQDILEFIFGEVITCPLRDGIALGNLVTKYPFPAHGEGRITAPRNAETHLWRMFYPINQEKVLVTAHGKTLREAKQRVYRSINNMASYDDTIQYRSDFYRNEDFLLVEEDFKAMLPRESG
tara:strand:+ start:4829 stop:5737 length:909 start_codon:yes stop_codon:yes gene_type:complete